MRHRVQPGVGRIVIEFHTEEVVGVVVVISDVEMTVIDRFEPAADIVSHVDRLEKGRTAVGGMQVLLDELAEFVVGEGGEEYLGVGICPAVMSSYSILFFLLCSK